jgi:hypothetical protein
MPLKGDLAVFVEASRMSRQLTLRRGRDTLGRIMQTGCLSAPAQTGKWYLVEVQYEEEMANHLGPESCVVSSRGGMRSVDRGNRQASHRAAKL